MSFERDWEPDRWEERPADRWERAEERERAEDARWERLTRDVGESDGRKPSEVAA